MIGRGGEGTVPAIRVRVRNEEPIRPERSFVLYWMISARRTQWNFALQRSLDHARALSLPLLILEPFRIDFRWASQRHHRFVLDGMHDQAEALRDSGIGYHPWVEDRPGGGKGLLRALGRHAAVVVTDLFPSFFIPRMVDAAARVLDVRLEQVDSNGLLPLEAAPAPFSMAFHFRRFLQKTLPDHLMDLPDPDPIGRATTRGGIPGFGALPSSIGERWPAAPPELLRGDPGALERIPVDPSVPPVPFRGGRRSGLEHLDRFIAEGLPRYLERNHPDEAVASGLSPWLHWGHVSAHEVFAAVAEREGWSPLRIAPRPTGRREGWWGMSPEAESFVDELITWREIGFVTGHRDPDAERYASLPGWARDTLARHAGDPRVHRYSLEEFDRAETHDPLWNAAQRQLKGEGRIHNYLRMLWGKKILEWSASPEEALDIMIELNNRYAVDGMDPNSVSGIFWVLGRYDRGWPERPVYGVVRSMSSDSTRRKVRLDRYLARWGRPGAR